MLNRKKLYNEAEDYFQLNGHAIMKLTPEAAMNACDLASDEGVLIWRVEGGIWHNPGFEMRLDCIWDWCANRESSLAEANLAAKKFILQESQNQHNAFILTQAPHDFKI